MVAITVDGRYNGDINDALQIGRYIYKHTLNCLNNLSSTLFKLFNMLSSLNLAYHLTYS